MKLLTKNQMHQMVLEELEMQKEMLFSEVGQRGNKKLRNALYELLGVMEYKKKVYPGPLLDIA